MFCYLKSKNQKIFLLSTIAVFLLAIFVASAKAQIPLPTVDPHYQTAMLIAAAQEASAEVDVEEKINLDENFKPEDFNLRGVGILPTSPFYFLKEARRGVTDFFTFNPVKKAERRLQFAAEKLLEAKALSEKEGVDEDAAKEALNNFKEELDEVESRVREATGRINQEEKEKLAEKVADSVLKYEKSLGKIEKELPPAIFEDIKTVKDETSQTFGVVFEILEPEKAVEKVVKVLDEQKGSEFKNFKNLEVLKEIETKVPEQAREAIRLAQENALNRLQSELENFKTAEKAIFEDFIKEIGGNEVRHLEIINELEVKPLSDELRKAVLGAKEEAISRAEKRLEQFTDAAQKEKFLEHLAEGRLEDLRVVKELENNVSQDVLKDVVVVKEKATENLKKKIESIDRDEKNKEEFLGSVERFYDAKFIAVLDEIESLIPEDKKEFFASLKGKAVEKIKEDIKSARDQSQRVIILTALAGDHPEEFEAINKIQQEVKADKETKNIFNELQKAQYQIIQERVKNIEDEGRFLRYEEEFKKREQYFKEAPADFGKIENVFNDYRGIFDSPDKALNKIQEAEKAIAELKALTETLPLDAGYSEGRFDVSVKEPIRLLNLAEKKVEIARTVLNYRDVGRAFGEAQAAESIARSGIELAQEYKAGKKRVEKPPEFLPPDFFKVYKPVEGTGTAVALPTRPEGAYQLYNNYEFNQFCAFIKGFIKKPFVCVLPDGRVFDASGQSLPITIPSDFIPWRVEPIVIEREVKPTECPLIFPKSCPSGYYRQEIKNEKGCYTPGECVTEQKLGNLCGGKAGLKCPSGYRCEMPPEAPRIIDAFGKCVPEVTCQAFWEGYVYDASQKICRLESATGCSDPYIYHTKGECEKVNGIGVIQPCPALPTVSECPSGQRKIITYSSPQCGDYYACVFESATSSSGIIFPYKFSNGFVAEDYESAKAYCYTKPPASGGGIAAECESKFGIVYPTIATSTPSTPNWVKHYWTFSDGAFENSFILNRTDKEYTDYIASVEAQCRTILRSRFGWKPNAGNDSADNWRNFGIPDCSGTYSDSSTSGLNYPGDANSCPGFSYSRWDSSGRRYCQLNNERKCDYDYPSYLTNGSNYKAENCPAADSTYTITPPSGQREQVWNSLGLRSWIRSDADSSRIEQLKQSCANVPSGSNIWLPNAGNSASSDFGMPDPAKCQRAANCPAGQYFDGANCVSSTASSWGGTAAGQTCDNALIELLGTGCHYMYNDSSGNNIFCDGPMTKSAKKGDTATTSGCSSASSGSGWSSTSYAGDANSCPGFSYSRWDSSGRRYCQLNNERSCSYDYPAYLTQNNYSSSNCPAQDSSTSASCPSGQYWYVPPSGGIGYCTSSAASTGDSACAELQDLLSGCHTMSENPNVRFNGAMDQYVTISTRTVKYCSSEPIPGCSGYSSSGWSSSSGSSGYSSSGNCLSYSSQSACQSASCVWYENHYDGTHCDDQAHGQTTSSSGGSYSGSTTSCPSGQYWYVPSSGGAGYCRSSTETSSPPSCPSDKYWYYPSDGGLPYCRSSSEITSPTPPPAPTCPDTSAFGTCSYGYQYDSSGCATGCFVPPPPPETPPTSARIINTFASIIDSTRNFFQNIQELFR